MDPLRERGAGGLPGPGSFQNALGAREESSRVAANGVASSVQDVNRYTAVVSDSPRRRSVGHASRSNLVLSSRGSGELRSVASATTRACPVGGPGDARRLGEPEFRLHALLRPLFVGATCRVPYACFSLVFSHGSTRSHPRRGPTERWPHRSGGPIESGISRGQGDRSFPARGISGQEPCAMFG